MIDILKYIDEMQVMYGDKEPSSMDQEPRNMYAQGQLVQPSDDGSRPGYKGEKPLTGDKFKEIVTKYPDMTNQELLDYLNKNKFTNRYGKPLNLNVITTNKTKFFDLAAETKAKIPKNYIISTEVFENLPISKKDYFRVKQAKEGGTLLTKEIDKLLKPVKIGDTFYFKKPGKNDSKSFSRLADKTGRLNNRIADLMLDFNTAYGDKFFSKGNVPDIDDVAKKFNITDSTAGKVTTRLAQWYGGQDFKNPQLKDLKRNKVTSNRLFKTLEKSGFGNPYRQGLYQVAMQTIDAKLGNKQGTFEKFKTQARQILKDNKIPVYNPAKGKDAFGFNINEIAGVTGSAKSKAAEFSQFVDVMEGNINTKAMAGFQSKLSTARAAIEKDPTKLSVESKKINKMAKNLEKIYGVQLPRLRDPDATKFFSPARLKELNAQGLDIVKAAERAGYTIEMPKGSITINELVNNPKKQTKFINRMMDFCPNKLAGGGSPGACSLKEAKAGMKKQIDLAKKASKDGKIPKRFGKLRSFMTNVFGLLDAPIELLLVLPEITAGNTDAAIQNSTLGWFTDKGEFNLEKLKDSNFEAYQFLKDKQARKEYTEAEETLDSLQPFLDKAQKEGTLNQVNPEILEQYRNANNKRESIIDEYQEYGYSADDPTQTPLTGKVATQEYLRNKVKTDWQKRQDRKRKQSDADYESSGLVFDKSPNEKILQYEDVYKAPTDLKSFIEQKGELGKDTMLQYGVRKEADRIGAGSIFDNFVLGMDTEYAGGKDIEDLYSSLPIEYASQLASLEKEDYEKGLAAIEQKNTDKFISQTEGAAEGGIMGIKRK